MAVSRVFWGFPGLSVCTGIWVGNPLGLRAVVPGGGEGGRSATGPATGPWDRGFGMAVR